MAGDWIKMRNDLHSDPSVIGIALDTGLDEFAVVGRLHYLWSWADQQTVDGCAASVTEKWIDRIIRRDGFAKSMSKHGWLVISEIGISFPHFDRHNGNPAKTRALAAKRQSRLRTKLVTHPAQQERDQRREEKSREDKIPLGAAPHALLEVAHKGSEDPVVMHGDEIPVMVFPCNGIGQREWPLLPAKLAEYVESFPGVDVLVECRKARQWCLDNCKKRKTYTGMTRFLGHWLGNSQNRGVNGFQAGKAAETIAEKLERFRRERECPSTDSTNGLNGTPQCSGSSPTVT